MGRMVDMASCDRLRRWAFVVCVLLLAASIGSTVSAAVGDEDVPLLPYRGLRPMGLGNAFEAIADDLNALDYNPAGLANLDGLTVRIVPAQVRLTDDLAEEISEVEDIVDVINQVTQEDEAGILGSDAIKLLVERVKRIRRENLRANAGILSGQVALPLPSLGGVRLVGAAGLTNQVHAGVRMRRSGLAWDNEILDILDDTVVVQGSVQLMTLQFALAAEKSVRSLPYVQAVRGGVNWRIVSRNYLDERFQVADLIQAETFADDHFDTTVDDGEVSSFGEVRDIIDKNSVKQTGSSIDVGMQIRHTDWLTSAYVIRSLVSDLGDTAFPTTHTVSAAARPLRMLDVDSRLLDLVVAGGISTASTDDALSEFENDSYTDNIHLGAEFTLFPRSSINFAVRVGNNQGYPTVGVEARLAVIRVGAAYYGDLEEDWWSAGTSLEF